MQDARRALGVAPCGIGSLEGAATTSARACPPNPEKGCRMPRDSGVRTQLHRPGGTLDKIARSTETLAASMTTLNATLLPHLSRTSDDTGRTVRQFGRLAEGLAEQPQSLILGRGAVAPGPGEPGFLPPAEK